MTDQMDPKKPALINAIRRVMTQMHFTGDWGQLRAELKRQNIRPLKAAAWTTATTLRNFCCLKNREKFADLLPAENEGGQLPTSSHDVTKTSAHEELPEPSPQSTNAEERPDYPKVAKPLPTDSAHDAYPAVTEELPTDQDQEDLAGITNSLPIEPGALSSQQLTMQLPSWFDDQAMEDLRTMILDFRQRRGQPTMQTRPVFRGGQRNSGIHVNTEILERAQTEAKRDKVRTGGSLSLLVELLLWQYIGSPEDLLEQLPTGSPDVPKG